MAKHRASVPIVANQGAISGPEWGLCADPNSQKKFPALPNCTLANSTVYWQYYYPPPVGFPAPEDRRFPIDPVLGPEMDIGDELIEPGEHDRSELTEKSTQHRFTPQQLLYPHQLGVAGRRDNLR